jgi:hypothetical protein
MPRRGRIELVGKAEERDAREREEALRELARDLHWRWRTGRAAGSDDWR